MVENGAPEQVPDGVAEEGEAGQLAGIGLNGQGNVWLAGLGGHIPAFSVKNHIGTGLPDGTDDLPDSENVQKPHQVKPEPVDVVFLGPIEHGVHDILADHGALGGGVIAAGGAVGIGAIRGNPAEISGDNPVEAEVFSVIDVIVHHVHDHTQTGIVEGFHHSLHLPDPGGADSGVGRVGAFGHVEIHRIIAPVVLGTAKAFVRIAVIKYGKQVDVGHAQTADVRHADGSASSGGETGLGKGQILSLVPERSTTLHGKVPDMKFIDHRIGDPDSGMRVPVLGPTLGVGAFQIHDHGPFSVQTGGPGVGVTGFIHLAVYHNKVGVINAVQVSRSLGDPGAAHIPLHGNLPQNGLGIGIAGGIQIDGDFLGSGSPQPEQGSLRCPGCAQIAAAIGILRFKLRGRIHFIHK